MDSKVPNELRESREVGLGIFYICVGILRSTGDIHDSNSKGFSVMTCCHKVGAAFDMGPLLKADGSFRTPLKRETRPRRLSSLGWCHRAASTPQCACTLL